MAERRRIVFGCEGEMEKEEEQEKELELEAEVESRVVGRSRMGARRVVTLSRLRDSGEALCDEVGKELNARQREVRISRLRTHCANKWRF